MFGAVLARLLGEGVVGWVGLWLFEAVGGWVVLFEAVAMGRRVGCVGEERWTGRCWVKRALMRTTELEAVNTQYSTRCSRTLDERSYWNMQLDSRMGKARFGLAVSLGGGEAPR